MGCNTVHIGGGEPFLDPEKLERVLKAAGQANVRIEYVETNSSWYKTPQQAEKILNKLKNAGLRSLLVSISPFHSEFTPLNKVSGVMQACANSGIAVLPWVQGFYPDLSRFDGSATISMADLEENFGSDYLRTIPQKYWIQPNGRAIKFLSSIYQMKSSVDLANDHTGCCELLQTNHFHIDLYGNFIPGMCAGLSIKHTDLGMPLHHDKYPLFNILSTSGPAGLIEMATSQGYVMAHEYLNKCHLCQDIRRFLLREKGMDTCELQPREFYAFI